MAINIFYRESHLAVDVTTLTPGSNKRLPQLNKTEVKTLQVCLTMHVFLPTSEIKMLNGNHIYSSLPKQTVNLAPPDLHASTCRKNGRMLHSLSKGKHTGQMKHNFQNILGCVHLSDLVKTTTVEIHTKL